MKLKTRMASALAATMGEIVLFIAVPMLLFQRGYCVARINVLFL